MFTRRAAATIFSNQRLQRWCFDVELVYVAQRLGVPISGAYCAWCPLMSIFIHRLPLFHDIRLGMLGGCHISYGPCHMGHIIWAICILLPYVPPFNPPVPYAHLLSMRLLFQSYTLLALPCTCTDLRLVFLPSTPEVQVKWTEMPGSKIRFTSILHMAFELATIKVHFGHGWGSKAWCTCLARWEQYALWGCAPLHQSVLRAFTKTLSIDIVAEPAAHVHTYVHTHTQTGVHIWHTSHACANDCTITHSPLSQLLITTCHNQPATLHM